MEVYYVDTSALVKLIRTEPETDALTRWLPGRRWVVSDLHRTELRRAAARVGPATAVRADELLLGLEVLTLDGATYDAAGRAGPAQLRSLDALHLTCALHLDTDLAGIVTYDARLLEAARGQGIATFTPS